MGDEEKDLIEQIEGFLTARGWRERAREDDLLWRVLRVRGRESPVPGRTTRGEERQLWGCEPWTSTIERGHP